MGPDEYVTREEFGLVVKLLSADIRQKAMMIAQLTGMLVANKIITAEDLANLLKEIQADPASARVKDRQHKLAEFQAIRKIAQQYLDPDQE
jgi:hypothetical protein